MSEDTKFIDGLYVDEPHPNAPEFIKLKIGIDRKVLGNWLRNESDDRINLDVKVSKGGKWYAQVDSWKPQDQPSQPSQERASTNEDFDDIPFN